MRLQLTAVVLALAMWPRPVARAAEVGDEASVRVQLVDGGVFDLAEHAGRVVLIDFWATWCGPCERSFPAYAELQNRYADDGLVVLAVSVDERLRDVERFLSRLSVPFPVAWDGGQDLVEAFAPPTMPTAYVVDRSGRIRHVLPGFHESELAATEALLISLLSEPSTDSAP